MSTSDEEELFPHILPMARWDELGEGLARTNRFVPVDQGYVDRLIAAALGRAVTLGAGLGLFRARIHPKEKELETEPLPWSEVGMAPPERVGGGRLNPPGIPYMYCSLDAQTAIAEVRPWLGARVTVGAWKSRGQLRVLDLRQESADVTKDLELISMAHMIGRPVGTNDSESYLPSQYLGERLKAQDIHGIKFDSSLFPGGVNVALFSESGLGRESLELYSVNQVSVTTSIIRMSQND